MTAHVKIEGFKDPDTDWEGAPLAKVGDAIVLIVSLSDYANVQGGVFTVHHPAMDPGGFDFDIPPRKATGKRTKLGLGERKVTADDLLHEETIECGVQLTRAHDTLAPFTLVAKTNCVTTDTPTEKVRCVADQEAFSAARVVFYTSARSTIERTLAVTKAGNEGLPAKIGNTVRTRVLVHLQLFFKDPDGDERPLPKGMPVKVLLGDHPDHALETTLGDDGKLMVDVMGHAEVLATKTLTLRFEAGAHNNVVCELPNAPKTQVQCAEPGETDATGTLPARIFTFPREWTLRESDWAVTNDDGRWDADAARFAMTKGGLAASLGKHDSRVKLVLDPHWQFVKFEFFDRTYGHSDHADKPKSLPAVMLEGFRYKPSKPTSKPDVRSNWWVEEGGETVQCVPWVLQRKADGTARKRPDRNTMLRFKLPAKTCVHSESATVRKRVIATDEQLKPGVERLKYYDLPSNWNSRNYYAKLSATAGEFGWYEEVAKKPTSKTKPLAFSLDDIVLTDDAGKRLATWGHDDRLAIFAHAFDDALPDCSKEGVYKPDDGARLPWYTKKPAAGAPEENENYIVDRPGWTRLIAAQGSLFDVFDVRTVESTPADPDYDVVGARAAVRWVDTSKRLGTTTLGSFTGVNGAFAWSPNNVPAPGMMFFPNLPTRVDKPMFSIHPYYAQDYIARFGKYLAAADARGDIGRFDMALVRCCGVAAVGGKPVEVAVNLYFHKMCFDATVPPIGMALDAYQVAFARNVMNRFNGLDAKNGQGRPEAIPKDATKPFKVPVVAFIQVTPEAEAHFKIKLTDSTKGSRDNRGQTGIGETGNGAPQDSGTVNGYASAHEHGHQSAFPDEYNERWNAASYGQPSFYSTLPGDPYELDGRTVEYGEPNAPMMNGMHTMHNRYFWQSAEWARLVLKTEMKLKLGGKYKDYWLPPYTTVLETKRHHAFWPLSPPKNDVALAPRAPLAANRAKVDLYLYAIGADAFAEEALPKKEDPPGAEPYDGILIVTTRVKVNAWGVKREQESDLKKLAEYLARVGRRFGTRKLNHTWAIGGKHGDGTPQAWTFKRCLVHFSPRLLVSGTTELEAVDTWETKLGTLKTQAVWTNVKTKLTNYHAVEWTDGDKVARLTTLVGPEAEPASDVAGDWGTASVINPHVRPPALGTDLDAKLATYTNLAATEVKQRHTAAKALAEAAGAWASSNPSSPFRAAAQALKTRAEAAQNMLGALEKVRELEKQASGLKSRHTEREATVLKVATAHAPHFTVNCKTGTPAKAEWDPLPVEGDLPAVAAWEQLVPASQRTGAAFNKVKGLLTSYKSKDALDLAGRIEALGKVLGPVVIAPVPSPRGAWVDGGKAGLVTLGTHLTNAEGAVGDDWETREREYGFAHGITSNVDVVPDLDDPLRQSTTALNGRVERALDAVVAARAIRKLEAHATAFRDHLVRWVSSTTLTITANSNDGFEEMMLEAFPSMMGAYKSASKIDDTDIKALVSSLTLDNLKVVDLTEA